MTSHATTDASPVSRLNRSDSADADVRLTLLTAEPADQTTMLDGAWWPRSCSLTGELPALIIELHRRGLRITRVVYNPELWDPAPHKVLADQRLIRLGWFDSIDPHLVSLTRGHGGDDRVDLLVVPPDTAPDTAAAAMTRAASPGNRSTPTAVLAAASTLAVGVQVAPVPHPRPADLEADRPDVTAWESEGGHVHR